MWSWSREGLFQTVSSRNVVQCDWGRAWLSCISVDGNIAQLSWVGHGLQATRDGQGGCLVVSRKMLARRKRAVVGRTRRSLILIATC